MIIDSLMDPESLLGELVAERPVRGQLFDERPVVEVVGLLLESPCPAEVVHRGRVNAGLSEPDSQVLVERMETSDVGEDHDPRRVGIGRQRRERVEPVAVRSLKDQALCL